VAARDEQQQIENALRSFLDCNYPGLQIIAVDDRSQDATGRIMDRLAEEDARLEVHHVTVLPAGWLGKNHALHVGAAAAHTELLLFTDGDVVFGPEVLQRAVCTMLDHKIDHLSLTPGLITGSYCERVLVSSFAFLFSMGCQLWLVPSRMPWFYMGVGAFNLVRRDVYQSIGGHSRLKFDVLDDVKLGKCIKQSGYRQYLFTAADQLWVRWQQSAWGVIRGLEKNAFAAADYTIWKSLLASLLICLISIVPFLIPLRLTGPQSHGFLATALLMTISYGVHSRVCGSGWRVAPALICGGLGMLIALWRSAWITLRQGGVSWRDTFYRIADLKQNIYK
jgi:cellulose synthase/poly-beta-1,6-N-acetylglucosamine synthase-like glycosyltransferase